MTTAGKHSAVEERLRSWPDPLELGVFVLAPLMWTTWILTYAALDGSLALDFQKELWPGARSILSGQDPYPPAIAEILATGANFVFPAAAGLLMAPFALLPPFAANVLYTILLSAVAFLILRLLGVRDWRVYGAVFLWTPMHQAIQSGNLTLLLALGAALAWRWRNRPWLAGCAVAIAVSLKLLLWPLLFWLIATRRFRAAIVAAALTGVVTVGSWFVLGLGFDGMRHYVEVLRVLSRVFGEESYTPFAFLVELGVAPWIAHAVGYSIAVLALGATLTARSDLSRFALAIAAALLFSPIVWMHYPVLLIVPLAVCRPTLSPLWLVPLVAWICPANGNGAAWQTALVLAMMAILVAGVVRAGRASNLRAVRRTPLAAAALDRVGEAG